jgi:uncharacterized protein (TIGR00730 family)
MMGSLADAALAGGGRVVGVLPRGLFRREVAHPGLTELHEVGSMHERKQLMFDLADAFVALPGGLGTLEELLEVWVAWFLGMHAKPVVALDPDGLFAPLREQVELLVEKGFVRRQAADALTWAETVAEAFDALELGLAQAALMPPHADEALEADAVP